MASLARYEYMNENEIDDELKCTICTQPFDQPVSLSCQHTFCKNCIEIWLNEQQSCPTCRQDENNFTPVNTQIITNQLNRLLVRCNQCDERNIQRGNFREHEEKCSKKYIHCPAEDIECSWKGLKDELDIHLTQCSFEKIRPIINRLQNQFDMLIQIQNEFQEKIDIQTQQINFLLAFINQGNIMNKQCLKFYSRCQYSLRYNVNKSKINYYCTICQTIIQQRDVALHACSLDEQINCICQSCYDKQYSYTSISDEENDDE